MTSTTGLHSLATIIKRLEAATSRLEDLAALGSTGGSSQAQAATAVSPQSAEPTPVPPPPPPPPPAAPAATPTNNPPVFVAYQEVIIDGKLKQFLEITRSFASESVIEQTSLLEKEIVHLGEIIRLAAACKKPDNAAMEAILVPLSKDIEAVTRAKEQFRKDRDWNGHHTVLAEGAPIVGWVAVPLKPGEYITGIKESMEYYGNRVIKDFKDKDKKHVEWIRAFYEIFDEMKIYVKKYHTTGLAWNPSGISTEQYKPAGAPAAAGGAPPPPPPPPPGPPPPPASAPAPAAGGVAAVFAELNRGEEVTKGLRKVDKSEMTHKNPALRAGNTVPSSISASASAAAKRPVKPSKPQALAGKKPTKFVLEGNKWLIEHFENESSLTVENTEINQVVNLYDCKNTVVIVKGKVNAVTIVNCVKTSVVVESVISSVSVTASPSFQLQITGSAPTIQLDSTDCGQVYLSKDCLGVEITTAKCSAINISVPVEGEEEGVFNEHPVPEMFKTVIKDGKLVTTVVDTAA
ncbi:hypothetical protein EIP86_007921 [Pleurotus ostreatoroseus]|nr:hypothetical protein EIP86_007921 [Pleurotus ostreatoroseus]